MNPAVESALAEMSQANDRLHRSLAKMSDEQTLWAPSPSARNAVHLVAHCAFSLGFIRQMFEGTPYPAPTMDQADAEFLEMEQAITTRQEALDLWADRYARMISFIENATDEQLEALTTLPFGLGEAPLKSILSVGATHTREHLAQLDYLQTILGDRSW